MDPQTLLETDRRHVWHPYARIPADVAPRLVRRAHGTRIVLDDGTELVDGMSSWWSAVHGYAHPRLDAAVHAQLQDMAHVMFGGLTHEPAVALARRLVDLTPAPLQHVFFADSGSVAVEVAIKMALQVWQAKGRPEKTRLLALRGGYHGDTFGAMAVCDPVGGMHSAFAGVLPQHVFADRPPTRLDDAYARHLEQLVATHAHELAAVIAEPVVQGAGGMRVYDPAVLRLLRELCDAHDVLLVLDEIATGFGRTGARFGCDHAGIAPDVMTVGKALTAGYVTMAATLASTAVAEGISAAGLPLMHGPTYMANALACSVAHASLDLLEDPGAGWQAQVPRIERGLRDGLAPAHGAPGVADVRVLGAIGVVQMQHDVDVAVATQAAVDEGVWVRPFRDLVYVMPPYVASDDDVARICRGVLAAVSAAAAAAG